MARSWTLHQTLSLGGSLAFNDEGTYAKNGNTIYFYDDTGENVWSYDGTTLTDISGATFGSSDQIIGIVYFKSNLYVLNVYNVSNHAQLVRWDSGTSWTTVISTLQDDSAANITYSSISDYENYMDADDDRIVFYAYNGTTIKTLASTNASTTSEQTYASGAQQIDSTILGQTYGSQYSSGVLVHELGGDRGVWQHSSGDDWSENNASAPVSTAGLIGYADGVSFWQDVISGGGAREPNWSDDWGVTLNVAGLPTVGTSQGDQYLLQDHGSGLITLTRRDTINVYSWNSLQKKFLQDGSTATNHTVYSLVVLNDTLYALCDSAVAGEAKVYDGGGVTDYGQDDSLTHSATGIPGSILI